MAILRWAAVPDLHAPYTCEAAWSWMLDLIERHRPHLVVQLGDWRDCEPLTGYPNDGEHTQCHEHDVTATQAAELRKRAGRQCKRFVHLEGNHGQRIARQNKRIREAFDWRCHAGLAAEWGRWEHLPYENSKRGVLSVGQLRFYHGFTTGEGAELLEMLDVTAMTGWRPNLLGVKGHTHRIVDVTQLKRTQRLELPWWVCSPGTAGPLKPSYASTNNTRKWGHGLVMGDVDDAVEWGPKSWEATVHAMDSLRSARCECYT